MGIDGYLAALGIMTKCCTNCRALKSSDQFYGSAKSSDGKASWCKSCVQAIERDRSDRVRPDTREQKRKWQLMSRYRITPDHVELLRQEQKDACPLCDRSFSDLGRFHVDHCHNSNEVRGLLCHRCNIRLGGWDDLAWRARAMEYLGIAA